MKNTRGIYLFGLVACLIAQSINADARPDRGERENNCPPQVVSTYCTPCDKYIQDDPRPGMRYAQYRFFLNMVKSDGQTILAKRDFYYYCGPDWSCLYIYKSEIEALNACNQALKNEPRCH